MRDHTKRSLSAKLWLVQLFRYHQAHSPKQSPNQKLEIIYSKLRCNKGPEIDDLPLHVAMDATASEILHPNGHLDRKTISSGCHIKITEQK